MTFCKAGPPCKRLERMRGARTKALNSFAYAMAVCQLVGADLTQRENELRGVAIARTMPGRSKWLKGKRGQMDWARVFSDETIGYVADFTTILVNGSIIGTGIYAYIRRREFLEWLRKVYASLLALIAELRAANELARAKATPPPSPPTPATSEQSEPQATQPAQPPPPPPPPSASTARMASAAITPASEESIEPTRGPILAWGIAATVVTFILIVATLRACSTPAPVVAPHTNVQAPIVTPAHPQPPPPPPPPPTAPWSYTVQPNESCWAIAERAEPDPAKIGRLWASIVGLNPALCSSDRHHVLRPGTVIIIPPAVHPTSLSRAH